MSSRDSKSDDFGRMLTLRLAQPRADALPRHTGMFTLALAYSFVRLTNQMKAVPQWL